MAVSEQDIVWMKLALAEAKKGMWRTSPNPCVGAVVVKNDKLIAKGYHKKAGTPHAEVHALRAAGKKAKGATIYVTLEPCNHQGKTPPCTEAILKSGISRVVVGMLDPNPLVAGSGCKRLSDNGLTVEHSIMEPECVAINRPFVKHITTGLPWVILKAGATLDGRIATSTGHSGWITNELSRKQVHRLRDRVDAILVGSGTALHDDPSLTTRLEGRKGCDPMRVVLDSKLQLAPTAKMLQQESSADTWIFCGSDVDEKKAKALIYAGAIIKPVAMKDGALDLKAVLCELGKAQCTSILVEGGGQVHGGFLRQGLVDEVNLFLAPTFIGADGIPLIGELGVKQVQDGPRFQTTRVRRFGDDILVQGLFV